MCMNGGDRMDMASWMLVAGMMATSFMFTMCVMSLFMENFGYNVSLAFATAHIQNEAGTERVSEISQKVGKESIRLNKKVRIFLIQALIILLLVTVLIVVSNIEDQRKKISLYFIAIGMAIGFVANVVKEIRLQAEIVTLGNCDKEHLRFKKVISDDEEMIGEDLSASVSLSDEMQEVLGRGDLIMIIETPSGDILFDRIWDD